MATFPETPMPIYPLTISARFRTITTGFDSGKEEFLSKWLFPKYDVTVHYMALSAANAQTLWNFFLARRGAYEAFYIYDLSLLESVTKQHVDQYVGTGDGSTTIFDIPGRSTSSRTVYVDGSQDSGLSILTGGGASDADRIQFNTAPGAGQIITVDFYGYLRMRVGFEQDVLDQEMFMTNLFSYGIKLRGRAAA